jgi:hypothetical protein
VSDLPPAATAVLTNSERFNLSLGETFTAIRSNDKIIERLRSFLRTILESAKDINP